MSGNDSILVRKMIFIEKKSDDLYKLLMVFRKECKLNILQTKFFDLDM